MMNKATLICISAILFMDFESYAQNEEPYTALAPRMRFISSEIGKTGSIAAEDRFNTFYPQGLIITGSNNKMYTENLISIAGFLNILRPSQVASWSNKWGHRFTENNNKYGNDLHLMTSLMVFDLNRRSKTRIGLGYAFEWNVEGVRSTDLGPYNIDGVKGKYGSEGLGSGVYKTRGRAFIGLAAHIRRNLDSKEKLNLMFTVTGGIYTGGGMTAGKLTLTYNLGKRFGLQAFVGYRLKSFKADEVQDQDSPLIIYQYPKVKVNSLDYGFSVMLKLNRWGGLGKKGY